jgi:O-antigen/teichoic acid export membrane protein
MGAFGSEFMSGSTTLAILLASTVLMSVSNVYGSALTSLGALWARFWLTVVWCVIVLGGLLLSAFWFPGSLGLAIAMLCAYLIQTLGMKICIMLHMKRTDLSKV